MVLIFSILLYALVADLVTTARTARLTGENDVLVARMDNHMEYCLREVEELLLTDLAAAAAAGDEGLGGGGGAGGLGGLAGGGGGIPGGDPGGIPGEEGEGEADPSAQCDGSRDAWYAPTAYTDNEVTTYVWVEDECGKFNLLTLVSPDQEFADESRERFVRLIDVLRAETDFDLTRSDGEMIADNIMDWMRSRSRSEEMPRPPLKTDVDNERSDISLPLHLDELLLLRGIEEDLFYDKVLDGRLIYGLESVLTIYTSMAFDPGDPNDPNNQPGDGDGDGDAANTPPPTPGGAPGEPPTQPDGVGIKININTAPRPVLRCLFSAAEMSDMVLDAILRYRNEEEETEDLAEVGAADDYLGVVDQGEQVERQVFTSLDTLDDIEEFANMPNPDVKDRLRELCGVNSDVFAIHMASLQKRNEENRVFVVRHRRSIMKRIDDGEDGLLHPLILLEQRHGLRVQGVDFPEEEFDDTFAINDTMDMFSQEEKAWNPFLLDFYLPEEERERLYSYGR